MNSLTSTPYNPNVPPLENIREIPSFCVRLLKILTERPLFHGQSPVPGPSKVLALTSSTDARLCTIIDEFTNEFLGNKKNWFLADYNHVSYYLLDENSQPIPDGLQLFLDEKENNFSFQNLEETYNQALETITYGWTLSTINENENIMFKYDTSKFSLYIKNGKFTHEPGLINCISRKFSMTDNIKCYNDWLTHPGYELRDKKYMWIRKSALNKVINTFGFKL